MPPAPGAEPAAAPTEQRGAPSAADKIKLADDLELDRAEFDNLRQRAAADAVRRATITGPESFKAELPADFVMPEGVAYTVDERDPLVARYRDLAFSAGLDQATFSAGLGLIASQRVSDLAAVRAAKAAEVGKLGPNAQSRLDSVIRWINGTAGPKAPALTNVMKIYPIAEVVEAFEHLAQVYSSQGISAFSQAHRVEPRGDGRIPGYDKMSYAERRAAQDNLRTRR